MGIEKSKKKYLSWKHRGTGVKKPVLFVWENRMLGNDRIDIGKEARTESARP